MNKNDRSAEHNKRALPAVLRALVVSGCVWFTVLSLCLLTIQALAATAEKGTVQSAVEPTRFLLLFPFSLTLAAAGTVRRSHLPGAARLILHPVLCLSGFLLFCYLPYGLSAKHTPAQVLLFVLTALILYAILLAVYLPVTRHKQQKAREEAPYQSQFNKH